MSRDAARELLRCAIDNPEADFRDGQWEAIDALVNDRRKLLVVQRTGWGKSSVYFISTRLLRDQGFGPTIIVSPLLALMRNQIGAAERLGINAITINSTNPDDWATLIQQVHDNQVDCILISPEKLANEDFVNDVILPIADRIGLFVVDETHCISDWGHDFRPDYRRLINILHQMPPNLPILGTTATANNRVINDIVEQLGDIEVQRGTLVRESLSLQNLTLPDQASRLAWLSAAIPTIEGAGIVYVLTKRDADQVTEWLCSQGIDAAAYYSGAINKDFENTHSYRHHLEDRLLNNQIKVLVATTALGMGYDKPDLSFVIHYQAPGSIVAYYQQVGRAGRGIDQSYGVLLSGQEDEKIHSFFRRSAFPTEQQVNDILEALEESDGLSIPKLQVNLNLRKGQIEQVVKFLSVETPAPVIKLGPLWQRTAVEFQMDHERIAHLTGQREQEWEEVKDYIESKTCLMEYLRNSLDDPQSEACGKCAICLGGPVLPITIQREQVIAAAQFLKHAEFTFVPRKQFISNAFPTYGFGYNIPEELRASHGKILSRWGDAGWGGLVEQEKHAGEFSDELVEAVADMIENQWSPKPEPQWITCVPSLLHTELVPAFAQKLANRLKLPFIDAISKVLNNQPQKDQQNSYHQCLNLDGAFEIQNDIPDTPVLLIDDVIDSRWTVTVLAALLRRQGSGEVYPVALASTSTGN